jgi:hypothetical protein
MLFSKHLKVIIRSLGILLFSGATVTNASPAVTVIETRTISPDAAYYHGWPTLARRTNGQLVVVCSGGREAHICPFGRVDLLVSNDNGATWTWPRTILDSDMDDRDAGILETARGTLLVTTFTSLASEPALARMEKENPEKFRRWNAAHQRLSAEQRRGDLNQWMIRSTDGGRTWSPRYQSIVNSPHGPIQLRDGPLLYAGKELWTGMHRIGVCISDDDGATWQWLAEIPPRPGDKASDYHELHAVECTNGQLIAHIRNENKVDDNETLQSESSDGGKTWSVAHRLRVTDGTEGVWGTPSHLLRLRDGRLLMSYGYRRAPFGNQVRMSTNEGATWSPPMTISADGVGGDLGYPSTVELDDGTFLTVWYERLKDSPAAVLRQARWKTETAIKNP